MTARTIYLVFGLLDYEGGFVIRAFEAQSDAEAFRERCVAHDASKPLPPDDALISDQIFEAWSTAETSWRKAHPAGMNSSYYDRLSVEPIELEQEK